MKKSIRNDMFIFFILFLLGMMSISILLNILFLENYYVVKNKDFFREKAKKIELAIIKGEDVQRTIEEVDKMNNMSVTISELNFKIKYTSFPKNNQDYKLPKEIEDIIGYEKINENYSIVKKGEEPKRLVYIKKTQDHNYIVISKSMKGIEESLQIANQFYILVGSIILVIGIIILFSFSIRITDPIIEMSKITQSISNLEFDKKIKVDKLDEIGMLGHSINKLSDKLKISLEELKNDVEFQKNMSRNIAHELKTPIGIIKGYTEGIIYKVADDTKKQETYLKIIVNECDKMNNLVIEMLELSKLQAKDYKLENIENVDVVKLVKLLKYRFKNNIEENGIKFKCEGQNGIEICGNYILLERAMQNLMLNAINYNNEDKIINIVIKKDLEVVKMSIFNTCDEIEDEEIEKIFEAFYKIDKSRTRSSVGSGLGLSIVKAIVNLHGGNIVVNNRENGIEFIIKFVGK